MEEVRLEILGIGAKHPLPCILQSVRRIHLTCYRVQPNSRPRNKVAINTVHGCFRLRISPAKSLAVPKVNTGLILHINLDVQVQEKMPGFVYDFVLGLPGQVGVKLKNVLVLHACCRWQIRMMVPDRLEQAARCQHALA